MSRQHILDSKGSFPLVDSKGKAFSGFGQSPTNERTLAGMSARSAGDMSAEVRAGAAF